MYNCRVLDDFVSQNEYILLPVHNQAVEFSMHFRPRVFLQQILYPINNMDVTQNYKLFLLTLAKLYLMYVVFPGEVLKRSQNKNALSI